METKKAAYPAGYTAYKTRNIDIYFKNCFKPLPFAGIVRIRFQGLGLFNSSQHTTTAPLANLSQHSESSQVCQRESNFLTSRLNISILIVHHFFKLTLVLSITISFLT